MWEKRSGAADREANGGGERGAGPSDALRALGVAGANVGADQDHQRLADGEDQWNLQKLEAHADAVAGERRGAEAADKSGKDDSGENGLERVQHRHAADAQDVPEQPAIE